MSGIIGVIGQREGGFEQGHLASDVIAHINDTRTDVVAEGMLAPSVRADMFVYTRKSDETFDAMMGVAALTRVPVVFASTEFTPDVSSDHNGVFINAPNLSVEALGFMDHIVELGRERPEWDMTIVEHHQAKKQSVSGTARAIADALGRSHDIIETVRDFQRSQDEFGVPDEHEGGFAIHHVEFVNPDTKEVLVPADLVILGRSTYADGALAVYDALIDPTTPEQATGTPISMVDFYRNVILARQA